MKETKYLRDNESLKSEWNYEKNKDIDVNKITLGSNKKVWWKCNRGHEWEATIYSRNNNRCPICSNKQVLTGYNDLTTTNPELASEWNYEKNSNLNPTMVTDGSSKKVWWVCEKGHEWQASINHRNNGSGCPICSNKQVLTGYNDLMTTNPELAAEWNYEKNDNLKPDMVTSSSNQRVWWKCSNGHEWNAIICNRKQGTGCPICSNKQVLTGYNDLATTNPEFVKEWNYQKNGVLKPDMFISGSNKKVWWICEKGHEWLTSIASRKKGTGCPNCAKELQTSFPEQAIYFYIKKLFPDAINGDRHLGVELDIYVPSKGFAVEYDGIFWHKDKKRDERKNNICKENKIVLFRVREDEKYEWSENKYLKIVYCNGTDSSLEESIKTIIRFLEKNINVDLSKDRTNIYKSFVKGQKEQSLLNANPKSAQEWNYERNGSLKPDMVSASSGKKVWWKCSKGHEWQAIVSNFNQGSGCPFCSGQQVLKGYNDLATVDPELAAEWNYEKNDNIKPDMVTSNSNQRVWWKCSRGHEWNAIICNRKQGTGCPICSNIQILKGYNDLATTNPELVSEWNYEKNIKLNPTMIKATSGKIVWWVCEKGHEWQASVNQRNQGTGCPICSNKQVLTGYNDLSTTNPELASEWNYEKNDNLNPTMVTDGSSKKVWWVCEKGHEWQASINQRTKGIGCPICSNKQVLTGYNDLMTTNPELAAEWNYEKNDNLKPDMVTAGSGKKVWWKCSKGHEWQTSLNSRKKGTKCPICSNTQVLEGYNDLATINPELASEWDYERNVNLRPTMVTANSGKQVWWKCSRGHEWNAEIRSRNRGADCPYCSGRQVNP